MIVVIYVDDAIFMGPNKKLLLEKKQEFMAKWECRDLRECKEFLEMMIMRDRSRRILTLDQQSYLIKILKHFNMENTNIAQTPSHQSQQSPSDSVRKADDTDNTRSDILEVDLHSLITLSPEDRPSVGNDG